MKKLSLNYYFLTLCITILTISASYSQNQQNQIDSVGNVGIGTTSPTHQLEVKGRAMVDSTLEVKDSATFRKRVRIEQDVIIMGKTFMRDHAVANQNLRVQNGFRVDGMSRFHNNVFADSTLRVGKLGLFENNVRVNGQLRTYGINNLFGVSRFHNQVRLLNLTDPNGNNQEGFMTLSGNGLVKRKDVTSQTELQNSDYLLGMDQNGNIQKINLSDLTFQFNTGASPCLQEDSDDPVEKSNGSNSSVWIPNWANKPGVLWTGVPCPASVGIGTDNPDEMLDVRGVTQTKGLKTNTIDPNDIPILSIHNGEKILQLHSDGVLYAKEIRVRAPSNFPVPDYVFEKDYNLLSIYDLESFIKKNKHLPEIPSAQEISEKGDIELAKMDLKLLKKVEELSLYVIELKKENDKLKKRLLKLENQ